MTRVIAAISTPPGKGGVAVIRMSGDGAFEVARSVFTPKSKKDLQSYPKRYQIYGEITEDGEVIDDVLLTMFPAPNSYTGEDVVEISCHGGILVTLAVLEALLRKGAVAAEAGEFTRRAFINGRMSLNEAESIGNLLEATSRNAIKLHNGASRQSLDGKISGIRMALTDLLSSAFARIDYPDEDLGDFTDMEVARRLNGIKEEISRLICTYRTGKAITEGVKTVICGKPNVGKSSVYNLIVGEDAAIVTDIEGTTRDVLERTVPFGGITLRLADTAGIRERGGIDAVERIGIERSRKMIDNCELLFAIFDTSREFDSEDENILEAVKKSTSTKIAIFNKSDLPCVFDCEKVLPHFGGSITISAEKSGDDASKDLSELVKSFFLDEKINLGTEAVISTARQNAALTRALDFVNLSIEAIAIGIPQDAVSADIERALGAISELDGRQVNEEVVSDIFSKFCVGK